MPEEYYSRKTAHNQGTAPRDGKRRRLVLNAEYSGAQAMYWMLLCCLISFASPFLLPLGYSASQIGIMLAAANLAALFLQTCLSTAADRYAAVTSARVLGLLYAGVIVCALAVFLLGEKSAPHALLYTLGMAFVYAAMPFVTSFQCEMDPRGEVAFGPCRAMGSLAYALLSLLLGGMLEGAWRVLLPVVGLVIAGIGTGLIPISLRSGGKDAAVRTGRREDTASFSAFLRENPRFFLLMLGCGLIFFFHNIQNNFMILIVENVGGGSREMGAVSGILAVVELPAMLFFGLLSRRFSCRGMLRFSLAMFTVKGTAVWLSGSVSALMLVSLLQSLAYAVYTPASVAYAAQHLPEKDMAKAQTGFTAAMMAGTVLSSAAGGFLIDAFGIRAAMMIGAAASLLGTFTAFAATRREKRTGR